MKNGTGGKWANAALINGYASHSDNMPHNEYVSSQAHWEVNLKGFCDAVETGLILVDFDARTNEGPGSPIRNHGTKFRIHPSDIGRLYRYNKTITQRMG